MPLSQNQINTVASQLAVNLSQVSTDRLVELCLLYRSCPDALPSFVTALKNEIIRRFTPEKIAENDTLFAVLQNFANQFASPIPYAHHQLLQMAETVNTDIWFVDNEQAFNAFINDTQVMTWLVKQLDLIHKILQNQFGLRWVASSTVASTAILTDGDAVLAWKQAPNLWRIWTQQQEGMTVLAKSSELMAWAADLDDAMTAVANSSTAMTAVANSSTAMTAVANSSTAMTAVINSNTAMTAVINSNTAMTAVANSSTAMTAVINSSTAMTAVINSNTAMTAVANSSTAMTAVINSNTAMTAVINSNTAMTAVINSNTAMTAVINSSTAMTAVINSNTAMTAVANSSTAMTAVANSSTAMTAVINSSTAMTAVANSSTAMTAVINSSTARRAMMANNGKFQAVRANLYRMVTAKWKKQAHQQADTVSSANNAMSRPNGLVFACLGYYYDDRPAAKTTLKHQMGATAATARSTKQPTKLSSIDGVSFNGATFTEQDDGYVYCELWVPR